MTAQASDTLRYADEFHSLIGISPDRRIDELFRPSSLGIKTCPTSTACWRGYIATYGFRGDQLVLDSLRINVVSPRWEEEHARLLAIKQARRLLPPHRRGPKAQAVRFDEGILTATHDRSADMAAIRAANAGRDPDTLGKPITPRGIAAWIGSRFDRGY